MIIKTEYKMQLRKFLIFIASTTAVQSEYLILRDGKLITENSLNFEKDKEVFNTVLYCSWFMLNINFSRLPEKEKNEIVKCVGSQIKFPLLEYINKKIKKDFQEYSVIYIPDTLFQKAAFIDWLKQTESKPLSSRCLESMYLNKPSFYKDLDKLGEKYFELNKQFFEQHIRVQSIIEDQLLFDRLK